MSRRLDKIEKDMGYCEVRLEKESRLAKQIDFLVAELAHLDLMMQPMEERAFRLSAASSAFACAKAKDLGVPRRPSRDEFSACALVEAFHDERDILERELHELRSRLDAFTDFASKRTLLVGEQREAMDDLLGSGSDQARKQSVEFRKVERQWNVLCEDLSNFDEGIHGIERNLDYLRSARSFLQNSKGTFDLEAWLMGGYLADLLRHSSLARAREMADGADRNLKMAQKELVALSNGKIRFDLFSRVLAPFVRALYDDVFVEGRIHDSQKVIEAALAQNVTLLDDLRQKREATSKRLEDMERLRTRLFTQLGEKERRKALVS